MKERSAVSPDPSLEAVDAVGGSSSPVAIASAIASPLSPALQQRVELIQALARSQGSD